MISSFCATVRHSIRAIIASAKRASANAGAAWRDRRAGPQRQADERAADPWEDEGDDRHRHRLSHAAHLCPQKTGTSSAWRRPPSVEQLVDRRGDVLEHVVREIETRAKPAEHLHPHFVCDQCGKVECLEASRVPATFVASLDVSGEYDVRWPEVVLHGLCPKCH